MEKDGLVPELQLNDLNITVEESIANGWLNQPPPTTFTERINQRNLSLETIAKKGKARDHYLWGLAGAIVSSERWRDFQSREQCYKLLMAFWGLRAPPRISALSGKGILDGGSVQPNFSGHAQHKDFVPYHASRLGPSQDESVEAEVVEKPKAEPSPVLFVEEETQYLKCILRMISCGQSYQTLKRQRS